MWTTKHSCKMITYNKCMPDVVGCVRISEREMTGVCKKSLYLPLTFCYESNCSNF